ncbi:hypothetical protein IX51_09810 [uncultured archaeon]|nr:hypothetical protein IX51_09810 [uncultured archaeon]
MLLLPGPVDVPDEVLKASAYVQNHRSDEFRDIVRSSSDLLNRFADSSASVITTGSGTTAVESMLYSMTSRNEGVLAVTFGEFGGRLVESLNRHGCNVKVMEKSYSDTLEPGEIADYISKNKEIKTVCLIHNETGNGTSIYNLREAAREAKNLGMKVLVDSVSGFGSLEVKANSWGIDAIASCSQKGLASVPGLGMVSISEEGLGYVLESADVPKYMDLSVSLKFLDKDETPYTPSTGSFNALYTALKILEREGIENRWKRHSAAAEFVREQIISTGSRMYGTPANYSNTVLAFEPPVPVKKVQGDMKAAGIQVSKGMKSFADKMVRVGLLGVVDSEKISAFLNTYFRSVGSETRVDPSSVPEEASFNKEILEGISEEVRS